MRKETPDPGQLELPSPIELARLRRRLLSQKEIADLVGVDPAQISRFEGGTGSMSYERIRRYAHVLNLRLASADPHRFLADRIANRGHIVELRSTDTLDDALDALVAHQVAQLPVRTPSGELLGVLTEVRICEALVKVDPSEALGLRVGQLPLEPLEVVRPGDTLQRIAAFLSSHWLVLIEDEDGEPLGFATRSDLMPLVLGQAEPSRRPG